MRIYAPNSTVAQLATNGIGNILCTSASVHEEINGEFSITIKVAEASDHLDSVVCGAIVRANTPRGPQLFRLSKPTETLDGGKEAFGWHISYDLHQDMILNRSWAGKTGAEVLPDILQAGISESRFSGTSDISLISDMRIVRTSVLGAIIGEQDNSYVNRWGGEIERDNFTVNMRARLGADKGVVIEYRKNLMGLTYEEDDDELANRIIPTGLDSDNSVIMLPEVYIDSERISETPLPHTRHVHFGDIKVGAKDDAGNVLYADAAAVQTKLRELVAEMYEQGVDLPLKSATVEFIDLSQTEEYKDFAVLQTVEIGDTVRCKYKNTFISKRVVSYDFDSLTNEYINIVLGNVVPVLGDSLWAQDLDLSALRAGVNSSLKEGEEYYGVAITNKDGFMTNSNIGGQQVTAKFNASQLAWYNASNDIIGGMALVNSVLAMIAGVLTNNINGECYAKIGDFTESGITYHGVSIFLKSLSTTVPAARIYVSSAGGGRLYIRTFGGASLRMDSNVPLALYDAAGVNRIYLTSTQLQLSDANGELRLQMNNIDTAFLSPDSSQGFGVDDAGPYYVKDYVNEYF